MEERLLTLKVCYVKNNGVYSPVQTDFPWNSTLLESDCPICGRSTPKSGCTCGIYATLWNGMMELESYEYTENHIALVGWAYPRLQVYTEGVRCGQWTPCGVLNQWHGESYNPGSYLRRPKWYENAMIALRFFEERGVPMRTFAPDIAKRAIEAQFEAMISYWNSMDSLFGKGAQ